MGSGVTDRDRQRLDQLRPFELTSRPTLPGRSRCLRLPLSKGFVSRGNQCSLLARLYVRISGLR